MDLIGNNLQKLQEQRDLIQKGLYGGLPEERFFQKAQATGKELKELVEEHKDLIDVLESPSHEDDKKEAKEQKKELEEYKEELLKAEGSRGGKVIGHTKSGKPIYERGHKVVVNNDSGKGSRIGTYHSPVEGNKNYHHVEIAGLLTAVHKDKLSHHEDQIKQFEKEKGNKEESNKPENLSNDELKTRYDKLVEMSKKSPLNSSGSKLLKDLATEIESRKDVKKSSDGDLTKAFQILGIQ